MRLIRLTLSISLPVVGLSSDCVTIIWNIVCARELVAFMFVDAVVRARIPAFINYGYITATSVVNISVFQDNSIKR